MYVIRLTRKAKEDLNSLERHEPLAYKKAEKLLAELAEHPISGTGHPEPLKMGDGLWSRRITKKHRLVYKIMDGEVIVLVLSAYGHYDDK